MNMILPIVLIVLSNTAYQIIAKSVPGGIDPFVSLLITYGVALIVTFLLWRFTGGGPITQPFSQLNWASAGLGVAVIGLEAGYILAYRAGWNISVCSLTANITLAVILIAVGLILYHESITKPQLIGVALCLAGLFLIGKK